MTTKPSIATDERFCQLAANYRAASRSSRMHEQAWKELCQFIDAWAAEKVEEAREALIQDLIP